MLEVLRGVLLGKGQEAVVDIKPQAVLEVVRKAEDHVPRAAPDLDRATPVTPHEQTQTDKTDRETEINQYHSKKSNRNLKPKSPFFQE